MVLVLIHMKTWQKIKENPKLLDQYLVREKVIDTIRSFFKKKGFHEVFTPILVPTPSCEPNLEVFETKLTTMTGKKRQGFLIMSPEYSIKKLLAVNLGSCFEITRCFRNNEEVSPQHNPEFTMLEWYRVNADYQDVMVDFENLFLEIIGSDKMVYRGVEYDLSLPWPRITVAEAFGTDKIPEKDFYTTFFNEVEPKLRASKKPTIIYDYPLYQASLAKRKKDNPNVAERFEVFLAGLELGNCFSELTDPLEQEKRFKSELEERKKLGKVAYPMDIDLINALKSGLPEVSGIAVGVDRLVMLAADVPEISNTLFFPAAEMFDI